MSTQVSVIELMLTYLAAQALQSGNTAASSQGAQTTAHHEVLQTDKDEEKVTKTGFELAELVVKEIEEVAMAPVKKVHAQAEPCFLPLTHLSPSLHFPHSLGSLSCRETHCTSSNHSWRDLLPPVSSHHLTSYEQFQHHQKSLKCSGNTTCSLPVSPCCLNVPLQT